MVYLLFTRKNTVVWATMAKGKSLHVLEIEGQQEVGSAKTWICWVYNTRWVDIKLSGGGCIKKTTREWKVNISICELRMGWRDQSFHTVAPRIIQFCWFSITKIIICFSTVCKLTSTRLKCMAAYWWREHVSDSEVFFKIKLIDFWILWSDKTYFLIVKINNFRGDLSSISAKKATLVSEVRMYIRAVMAPIQTVDHCRPYHFLKSVWIISGTTVLIPIPCAWEAVCVLQCFFFSGNIG